MSTYGLVCAAWCAPDTIPPMFVGSETIKLVALLWFGQCASPNLIVRLVIFLANLRRLA